MAPMEASPGTDEALLQRYARGEAVAFDLLYGRHELPLWRYVLRLTGDRVVAEELTQDVWFAVVREAPRFRADVPFVPWLYTVARNPALPIVSSLANADVDSISARVRAEAGLAAETFYGAVFGG